LRLILPAAVLLLASCQAGSPQPAFEATNAFIYAPLTPAQGAGYFVLHNRTPEPDTLLAVTVDWARATTIHQTSESDGMVRMSHLSHVAVPAMDSLTLAPGGIHLMFMDLSRMPVAGDTVQIQLHLQRGGVVAVRAAVRPYGQE